MFKSNKLAVLAALLSLLMLVSLLAVPAFADDADATEPVTTEATVDTAETADPSETEAGTNAGTETEAGTSAGTSASTEASTKKEETTTGSGNSGDKGPSEDFIRAMINLGVGVIFLVAIVILAIKFRAKIPGWWKGLKSECGKITWCPKDKLKKNVFVVVVIIIAIAFAIGVLDFVFSTGIFLLKDLI